MKHDAEDGFTAACSDFWEYEDSDDLVVKYFRDVRNFPLLSKKEEKDLWRKVDIVRARINRIVFLSPAFLPTLADLLDGLLSKDISPKAVFKAPKDDDVARLIDSVPYLQDLERRAGNTGARNIRSKLLRERVEICENAGLTNAVLDTVRSRMMSSDYSDSKSAQASLSALNSATRRLGKIKEKMVLANMRLAIHIANFYRGKGVSFLDLIQEGNIGLSRAFDKFEPKRGFKFVTYAYWWVKQGISRFVITHHRTVRLPNHIIECKNKLIRANKELWYINRREPTDEERANMLGWTEDEVVYLKTATLPLIYADECAVEEDSGLTIFDMIQSCDDNLETSFDSIELSEKMRKCMSFLSERERFILYRRYGFGDFRQHTLQEIADILGLSRERVRQIEKFAIKRLKTIRKVRELEDFVV